MKIRNSFSAAALLAVLGWQAMPVCGSQVRETMVLLASGSEEDASELYAGMQAWIEKARQANVPPMGAEEAAALTAAIEEAEATPAGAPDVAERTSALQAAVDRAAAWLTAYDRAKAPLVAALQRFERDYNDGVAGPLRPMSAEAWGALLEAVADAAEAKDVTDAYDGFAGAASAFSAVMDATDESIRTYSLYEKLMRALRRFDGVQFADVLSAAGGEEHRATDAALADAVRTLNDAFCAYVRRQETPLDASVFLGENLDFEASQGEADPLFTSVFGQPDWNTSFTGSATDDNRQYTHLERLAYGTVARPSGVTTDHYLYIRSKWMTEAGTARVLKETALPAGSYALSFYLKTDLSAARENLCYYEVDGVRKKVSATGSWRKRTVNIELDEPAVFCLSFGFTGGDGSNNAELWVDDITLTLTKAYAEETGIGRTSADVPVRASAAGKGRLRVEAVADGHYAVYTATGIRMDGGSLRAGETRILDLQAGVYVVNGSKMLIF